MMAADLLKAAHYAKVYCRRGKDAQGRTYPRGNGEGYAADCGSSTAAVSKWAATAEKGRAFSLSTAEAIAAELRALAEVVVVVPHFAAWHLVPTRAGLMTATSWKQAGYDVKSGPPAATTTLCGEDVALFGAGMAAPMAGKLGAERRRQAVSRCAGGSRLPHIESLRHALAALRADRMAA